MRRSLLIAARAGLSVAAWLVLLSGRWPLACGLFFVAFVASCIPLSRSAE